jgi:hypothetical protein
MPAVIALTVKVPPPPPPPPPPPAPPADFPVVSPSVPINSGQSLLTGWRNVPGYRYELQIAQDSQFSQPVQSVTLRANYWVLPALPEGAYYLRLRLRDDTPRFGVWCDPVPFGSWQR